MKIIDDLLPERCYDAESSLAPSVIVLHATAGSSYAGARSAYVTRHVSPHYTVDVDGTIYRNVPEEHCAYHAGASMWRGRKWVNLFAIGIEMVGVNTLMDEDAANELPEYPMPQVEAVKALVLDVAKRNRISWKNIVTHAMVSPGRKADPSGFHQYFDILEGVIAQELEGKAGFPYEQILVPEGEKWVDVQGKVWENSKLKVNATYEGKTYVVWK